MKGKKLGRNHSSRKALLKGLIGAVIQREKIETTLAKAKFLQPDLEKLISISKDDTLYSRRRLLKWFEDKKIVEKLLKDIGPRFKDKKGGYTRIRRTDIRQGDSTQMVQVELVEGKKPEAKKSNAKEKTTKTSKK